MRNRRDAQADARELARPQPVIAVREAALQLDRVRGGVDEVVDEAELAFDRHVGEPSCGVTVTAIRFLPSCDLTGAS